jgi:hypothetical protein
MPLGSCLGKVSAKQILFETDGSTTKLPLFWSYSLWLTTWEAVRR